MKKKYVRPESRLLTINLTENIASSVGTGTGTGNTDVIGGGMVIHFTQATDGCRGLYTGDNTAPVHTSGTFNDYYTELRGYGNLNVFLHCLELQF